MEQTDPNGFTLNICSPNDKFIHQIKDTTSNVLKWWFFPEEGVKITRVCDDNGLICECDIPVTYVMFFHKDDTPYLLWVRMGDDNSRYFVKEGGKWNEITLDEHSNIRNYLTILADPDKHITIDVSKSNPTEFWRIDEYNHGRGKQVEFLPNFGCYARAVVDGGKTIWKPENDAQRCIGVTISYNQNQKGLICVRIRDIKNRKSRNYKWVKGQWDEIDDATYFNSEWLYDSEDYSYEPENSKSEETLKALSDLVVTCQ